MKTAAKAIPQLTESDKLRFLSKISIVPTERGCLEWMEGKSHGYGKFWLSGSTFKAHRVAYFLHHGVDPGVLDVCHKCDNPSCCNPEHHFMGTDFDNNGDKARKGRAARFPGESNAGAKLKESDIPSIRADPRSLSKIAIDYGVCKMLVSLIKRRKIWNHV